MNYKPIFAAILSLVSVGAASRSAIAAAPTVPGFAGQTPSTLAGCPYIIWRLVRHDDGQITGIAYYSDLTGLSMVSGSFNQAGQFELKATSAKGSGPAGSVMGTRSQDGSITARKTGEGCANVNFSMKPTANLNEYHEVGS